MEHGFYTVAAATTKTVVADCAHNAEQIYTTLEKTTEQGTVLTVFPELSLTAYTCADLFLQQRLLDDALVQLRKLLGKSASMRQVFIVGLPVMRQNRLYNCAAVCQSGELLGIVPKSYIPNNKEFYEKRWFESGKGILQESITLFGRDVPFGTGLLFGDGAGLLFGVELCEDLWALTPPSSAAAAAGATLIANLSSSNEVVSKASYRRSLVSSQSARLMSGYIYASSGVGESTTDLVFSGDCMIAENGAITAQNRRFVDENQVVISTLDLQKMQQLRLHEGSYCDADIDKYQVIDLHPLPQRKSFERFVDPHPFVPHQKADRQERVEEILSIQKAALAKRLKHIGTQRVVLGISGGLDSTLALLMVHDCFQQEGFDVAGIECITMPGYGTTNTTKGNAHLLCEKLGIKLKEIDITPLCQAQFDAIGHDPSEHSVVYENVQARTRTQILMDRANKIGGIVIGTGDLSEIALGWSTYNGDHMSMYAINCSIPKTLIRYIIEHFAAGELERVLQDILETPVSPELLPHENGAITQETEKLIGPYELHDFFLYHFVKYGATPEKLLFLACKAFEGYGEEEIEKWLKLFIKRFFTQQFKRSAIPDGPKVGTISLSPRGDWRMPSDASFKGWL